MVIFFRSYSRVICFFFLWNTVVHKYKTEINGDIQVKYITSNYNYSIKENVYGYFTPLPPINKWWNIILRPHLSKTVTAPPAGKDQDM